MPAEVGICLKKNSPFLFLFLFSYDNNKNHEKKKKKGKKKQCRSLHLVKPSTVGFTERRPTLGSTSSQALFQ
jgi:hypothetical protein